MRPRLALVLILVGSLPPLARPAAAQSCTGCIAASFAPAPLELPFPPLPSFDQLPTADGPGVAAADLNGDGFPDLAVTALDGVAVLLADGAGGFGPATLFPGPRGGGTSIAVGDFNRDGRADVVTIAGSWADSWQGDGTGGLGAPTAVSLGSPSLALAAGDVNGDGKPDVVVGFDAGAAVLLGDGAGGFGAPATFGSGLVTDMALGDLNGDGRPDLASVGPQGVSVRLGDGAGGFGSATSLAAGLNPRALEIADLDGDGKPDLAVVSYGEINSGASASVSVLRGSGSGAFAPPISQAVAVKARDLAVADWNRDGRADVAVASQLTFTVFLGQPGGGLLPTVSVKGGDPVALVAGDWDRDGFPDVALLGSASASVFLGDGAGGLELPALVDTGSLPRDIAVADFNGDGLPDIAASRDSNDFVVLLGSGGGAFGAPTSVPVGAKPGSLATGDFDGDGHVDLAVLADAVDRVRIFLGDGAGGFGLAFSFPAGPFPGGLAAADLNGDGRLDLVVGNAQDGEALYTFLGNGNGSFGPPLTVPAFEPASPVVADVNGDGHPDVVARPTSFPVYLQDTAHLSSPSGFTVLEVFLGNGDGTLQPAIPIDLPFGPSVPALVDVDGDGDLDVVVAGDGGVYMVPGDGTGQFGAPTLLEDAPGASFVAPADVNADGHADLLVGFTPSGAIRGLKVLVADGTGGFLPGRAYAATGVAFKAADVDGDGRPEVLYPRFYTTGIGILRNTLCEPRRFRIVTDVPTCNAPGQPFTTQPVIQRIDDGGNLVQCATGGVTAVFVPGTAPPGATILGTTTIPFVGGLAAFTDLAVDLPGSAYQIKYEQGPSRRVRGRSFSQGLTVDVAGPGVVAAGTSATYSASPGFQWYDWTLDTAPVSTAPAVTLGFPAMGTYALSVAARQDGCTATSSRDIVVGPLASATGGSVLEGDAGQTSVAFTVSLSAPSTLPVTVSYASADITALAGSDYQPASGTLSFAPGATAQPLAVSVLGDVEDEPDEVFALQLTGASNAVAGAGSLGRILDDDGAVTTGLPEELVHGAEGRASLQSLAGVEQSRWYVMRQAAWSSYEVVVDGVSGDVLPLHVERLAADGSLLQSASAGAGAGVSLAWENASATSVVGERIRVGSGGCSTACGAETGYRIRAYDTGGSIARFNNEPNQTTFLLLENGAGGVVSGHARFWKELDGALLATYPFSLGPRQSLVLNTTTLPGLAGQRGSVTVSSDAPYGALTGKAAGLDPVLGFSFDTPMRPRPR